MKQYKINLINACIYHIQPGGTFTTAEYLKKAQIIKITERCAKRWLNEAEGILITKVKHGVYEKI